jgi:hypothetical protein
LTCATAAALRLGDGAHGAVGNALLDDLDGSVRPLSRHLGGMASSDASGIKT